MLPLILVLTSRTAHARDLRTADAVLLGPAQAPYTGWGLADVGDVDGDGHVDVLIGVPTEDASTGVTYLLSGPVTGRMDLSDAATRFVTAAHDGAGQSVAGAGDVDADGYDDVLIGAPGYGQPGRPNLGAAYLVLGPVTGSFDLSLADATFVGPKPNSYVGGFESVSSAGDVDGDGLPDLLMGASGIHTPADAAGCCTGAAFVMSGTRRGSQGMRTADASIAGGTLDTLGSSVAGLGDVDGDGLDDFLVASYGYDEGAHHFYSPGVSYVWFGPVGGQLDPSDADAKLIGEGSYEWAGTLATAAAGDVDADGLRDILLGASSHSEGADYDGAAYLVRGGVTGTLLLGDADAKLVGEAEYDEAGWSVSGAGDVDADGHDDLLVGAWQNDEGGPGAGAAYLVRGPVTGSLDLGRADRRLVGAEGEAAGMSVSSAGDLDGDGRADLLVGARRHTAHGRPSGAAYILYGNGL